MCQLHPPGTVPEERLLPGDIVGVVAGSFGGNVIREGQRWDGASDQHARFVHVGMICHTGLTTLIHARPKNVGVDALRAAVGAGTCAFFRFPHLAPDERQEVAAYGYELICSNPGYDYAGFLEIAADVVGFGAPARGLAVARQWRRALSSVDDNAPGAVARAFLCSTLTRDAFKVLGERNPFLAGRRVKPLTTPADIVANTELVPVFTQEAA